MYSYFFRSATATAVLLLLATALSAQNHPVSGLITAEAGGDPLEYATVSAYAAGDSLRLIDGTVTDAAGRFNLSLPAADYRLEFGFIGLATRRQALKLVQATDLGEISLTAVASSLDAVEVTAERTRMSLQLDKKVFEVGQDALSRGGSATNVLEQLPSIMVSADGQVSLRGNSGVRILVNGRPSALADNNALEAIPAASIERVEIITNPSARYEAAGSAGIINIILKK
ncbi:MAG: carboxypeptidase regulatory-like domain-containing protein, partial [Saprospiraceae bacterium]